jgi:hypothetical protein
VSCNKFQKWLLNSENKFRKSIALYIVALYNKEVVY